MSTDRSTDIVRALGVPDPRLVDSTSLWTSQTTWPEQGPRPGRPVDSGDSSLVLSAYGNREDDDEIQLVTTKAGSIDPITGAGFAWRESGDPLYRGRVAPSSIWGWDTIHYVDGSSTVVGAVTACKEPHTVATASGALLVTSQVTRYNTGESVQVSGGRRAGRGPPSTSGRTRAPPAKTISRASALWTGHKGSGLSSFTGLRTPRPRRSKWPCCTPMTTE